MVKELKFDVIDDIVEYVAEIVFRLKSAGGMSK